MEASTGALVPLILLWLITDFGHGNRDETDVIMTEIRVISAGTALPWGAFIYPVARQEVAIAPPVFLPESPRRRSPGLVGEPLDRLLSARVSEW